MVQCTPAASGQHHQYAMTSRTLSAAGAATMARADGDWFPKHLSPS